MTQRYHLFLANVQQGNAALNSLYQTLKPFLLSGQRFNVIVSPENRTDEQNRKFHAICSDLEKSRLPWFNAPRTAAEWKVTHCGDGCSGICISCLAHPTPASNATVSTIFLAVFIR